MTSSISTDEESASANRLVMVHRQTQMIAGESTHESIEVARAVASEWVSETQCESGEAVQAKAFVTANITITERTKEDDARAEDTTNARSSRGMRLHLRVNHQIPARIHHVGGLTSSSSQGDERFPGCGVPSNAVLNESGLEPVWEGTLGDRDFDMPYLENYEHGRHGAVFWEHAERGGEALRGHLTSTSEPLRASSSGHRNADSADGGERMRDGSGGNQSICELTIHPCRRERSHELSKGREPTGDSLLSSGGANFPSSNLAGGDATCSGGGNPFIGLVAATWPRESGCCSDCSNEDRGEAQQELLERRVHPRGTPVHRPSRDMVSCPMGGVPPLMGAVENQGEDRRSVGDVGTSHQREEDERDVDLGAGRGEASDGSIGLSTPMVLGYPRVRLVWNRDAVRTPTSSACRVAACQIQRAQHKHELQELSRELDTERRTRKVLVAGESRAAWLMVQELQQQLDAERAVGKQRLQEMTSYKRKAVELAHASVQQTQEIANLKGEVASLNVLLEERARESRLVIQQKTAAQKQLRKLKDKTDRQLFEASIQSEASIRAIEEKAAEDCALAERRVSEAEADSAAARVQAEMARAEALAEAQSAADDRENGYEWEMHLLQKRLSRAQQTVQSLRHTQLHTPSDRSPEEWARLSYQAQRQATRRERLAYRAFHTSHTWRASDVAAVLQEVGLLESLFDTKEGTAIYVDRVSKLLSSMEQRDFGESFALYLHFDLQLTLDKIHRIMQAASKRYDASTDRYISKILLYDKYRKGNTVKVPRIVPPRHKLEATLKRIYGALGVDVAENGRIAFSTLTDVIQQLMAEDVGKYSMPPLPGFAAADIKLPIVVKWDATGFGHQQFCTVVLDNPYTPKSSQHLRIFGLGNCSDGRDGIVKVLGPNLACLNELIEAERADRFVSCGPTRFKPEVFVVNDLSALRHCERLANSGWCSCSRDFALRSAPRKPNTVEELQEVLAQCKSPTYVERCVLSHNTVPGEGGPRPCIAPGCTFAHSANPAIAVAEQSAMYAKERELQAVETKAGRQRFSSYRMEHARMHGNVQPGRYGEPMLRHDMDNQILDALHLAILNAPKTFWKYGILNNSSDDAREKISEQLKRWKHKLDCRRKEDNRVRENKWFTGEAWSSFCEGQGGSPGGPRAIAELVLIIADDLLERGVDSGAGVADDDDPRTVEVQRHDAADERGRAAGTAGGRGRGRGGRGRASFVRGAVAAARAQAQHDTADEMEYHPSAMEENASPEDLKAIRDLFGSRAEVLINILLGFDSYFKWYYPLKESIPFRCDHRIRLNRALDNCRLAVDMQEMAERVTMRNHKSFIFHGAVFKLSRDIIRVGDLWALDLSALELLNADTKHTAHAGGSRRLEMSSSGLMVAPKMRSKQGPAQLVTTKGYSTTMALSTIRKLLGKSYLRRGHGLISLPESRRRERLFGESGGGRLSYRRAASACLELIGNEYKPREDTCVAAFVRLLAARAAYEDEAANNPQ